MIHSHYNHERCVKTAAAGSPPLLPSSFSATPSSLTKQKKQLQIFQLCSLGRGHRQRHQYAAILCVAIFAVIGIGRLNPSLKEFQQHAIDNQPSETQLVTRTKVAATATIETIEERTFQRSDGQVQDKPQGTEPASPILSMEKDSSSKGNVEGQIRPTISDQLQKDDSAQDSSTNELPDLDTAIQEYARKVQSAMLLSVKLDQNCNAIQTINVTKLLYPAVTCLQKTSPDLSLLQYPPDAHQHFNEVRDAMKNFVQHKAHKYHTAVGYDGPWIENHFISHFETIYDERIQNLTAPMPFCLHELFGPYIPLFIPWTDHWVLDDRGQYPDELWPALLKVLRPEVPYIAVVQNAEGLVARVSKFSMYRIPNVLVLSAGGYGHVPLPLIKQVEDALVPPKNDVKSSPPAKNLPPKRKAVVNSIRNLRRIDPENRAFFTSYVGSRTHAPRNVRNRMVSNLSQLNMAHQQQQPQKLNVTAKTFSYYKGPSWKSTMSRSYFSLCPRGYGRTSYHLMETWQMGLIPIHVYTDIPWVPYQELVEREQLAIMVPFKRLTSLIAEMMEQWNPNETTTTTEAVTTASRHSAPYIPEEDFKSDASSPVWSFDRIRKIEERIMELRESHFTVQGVLNHMHKYMLTGEIESDLRCQSLPRSIRDGGM